jgi:hypothetical protein
LKKASFTLGGEWRGLLKTTKQPKIWIYWRGFQPLYRTPCNLIVLIRNFNGIAVEFVTFLTLSYPVCILPYLNICNPLCSTPAGVHIYNQILQIIVIIVVWERGAKMLFIFLK